MLKSLLIEGFADSPNSSIHHVAGANQIRPGPGLGNGLAAEDRHRFIVEHYPFLADDAVMAVAGVGIEGHVRHDRHLGVHLLKPANSSGYQATFVEAFGAVFGFKAIGHLGKQHNAADAQVPSAAHLLHQAFEAPAHSSWHGTNGLVGGAFVHEERINKVGST